MMCTRNGDTRNKQYYISVSDRWYTVKFQTEWINYIKSAEWELIIKISINDTNPKWPLNLTITWCPQSLFLVSYVVWNDLWVYIILFQYVAFVTNCLFFTLYQFDKKKTYQQQKVKLYFSNVIRNKTQKETVNKRFKGCCERFLAWRNVSYPKFGLIQPMMLELNLGIRRVL